MSERIGKYRVIAKIGEGGMARVLLTMAEGPHGFHKLLVMKVLRVELAHDLEFVTMFLDEARIAARLNHPNIVQTYEVGDIDGVYFIAMEYLEGQPLSAVYRRVGRAQVPLEVHVRILADVLAGLDHAHRLGDFSGAPLGMVHRDVSPQNVFVTYAGQVKLVDFGIAKVAGASSTTRQGTIKGKLSYIAPEQCRCEDVDARADVFSVGVMLWEALTGRRLVLKDDEKSVLARRMAGEDLRVRDVAPDVPAELASICDRAMAPEPDNRFQSAGEFRDMLERYLARSEVRVGASDLARLLADAFEDERGRIGSIIEEQVATARTIHDPITLDLHPNSFAQTGDSLPRVMPSSPHLASQTPPASHLPYESVPPPQSRKLSTLAALGGLAAALVLAVYVWQKPASESDGEVPGAAAPSSARPATVAVTVRYPEGARLKLDGGYVEGQPFKADVPRDGSIHKLEVEQDGFVTETRTVTFDRDIDVAIEPTARTASSGPMARTAPGAPRGPLSRPSTSTSTTASTSTSQSEDPGPKKRPPSAFGIDEDNPYKNKK